MLIGKQLKTIGGNVLLLFPRSSSLKKRHCMTPPLGSFDLEYEDTTVHQNSLNSLVGLLDLEYEATTILRNIGNYLPIDTA
jgi:hypothetical protein